MLNQLLNIFWTAVFFVPVGFYWGGYFAEKRSPWWLSAIIVISLLVFMVPARGFSALTISKDRKVYERVGVTFVRWFVQNGKLVAWFRGKYGTKSSLIHNRKEALNYMSTIAMQERYHYSCFVLFLLSTIDALYIGKTGIALLMLLCNVLYNVYPILLQQYNKLRINSLLFGRSVRWNYFWSKLIVIYIWVVIQGNIPFTVSISFVFEMTSSHDEWTKYGNLLFFQWFEWMIIKKWLQRLILRAPDIVMSLDIVFEVLYMVLRLTF